MKIDRLKELCAHMAQTGSSLQSLKVRVRGMVDGMIGPEPDKPATTGALPDTVPQGTLIELSLGLTGIDMEISRIHEELSRL